MTKELDDYRFQQQITNRMQMQGKSMLLCFLTSTSDILFASNKDV